MESDYQVRKMQQASCSRSHQRTSRHKSTAAASQQNLLLRCHELQLQVNKLKGLLHQEKALSEVQRNMIMGLQQELKRAERNMKTQTALKEWSFYKEKETKKELERLIKESKQGTVTSEKNGRHKRRKNLHVDQGKMESSAEEYGLQRKPYTCCVSGKNKKALKHESSHLGED